MQPFTLLIKPSGSDCNVDCKYCFYKKRPSEIGTGKQRMSDEVLEKMTTDYMKLNFPVAGFAWQGGEPALMGLDFYKRVVDLQRKYGNQGQVVSNSFQTNAILLDDDWCKFLSDNNFLVGISIDGPKKFHDYYRLDYSGGGTFDRVVRALELCKKYKVQFNTLVLLNNVNVQHPDEIIDFFLDKGIKFLQFIPCVEVNSSTNRISDFSVTPK
ncbi:MAG: radical SAM protein, partial [Planctomycetota bacterium]